MLMNDTQWGPRRKARSRALQALYQFELTGQDVGEIITQFRDVQDFSEVDIEYFRQLVRGVATQGDDLVERLQPLLDRPFEKVDTMERILLLLGTWQLVHEPGVPFQVVLDETIILANRFGSAQSHAYVNGVLDRAVREWQLPAGSPASPA